MYQYVLAEGGFGLYHPGGSRLRHSERTGGGLKRKNQKNGQGARVGLPVWLEKRRRNRMIRAKNVAETDKLEWKNVAGLVIIKITEIKIRRQVHVET